MAYSAREIPEATLRLLLAPGVGPVTMRRLAEVFGSHERAVGASVAELSGIEGIGRTTAQSLRRAMDEADVEGERAAMEEHGASIILHGEPDYPALLAVIGDPPAALWIRGALHEHARLAVAIVGSRKCSAYGREQAARFASLLAQSGLAIVSGGALGIDGEAHRGALRVQGRTIAVMGCGLAVCYPPEHGELFEKIAAGQGALVSEHPMRTPPIDRHFPARNRIISGLSLGVLVIEAALRSGALITARLAAEEHGREVMALPGRVDSPQSAGCLRAIREGWAALVLDHADVIRQLDESSHLVRGALQAAGQALPGATPGAAPDHGSLFDAQLTEGQRTIVEVLVNNDGPLVVDQLASRTGLPLSQVMTELTLLQIRGRVARDHRGVSVKRPKDER